MGLLREWRNRVTSVPSAQLPLLPPILGNKDMSTKQIFIEYYVLVMVLGKWLCSCEKRQIFLISQTLISEEDAGACTGSDDMVVHVQ